MMKILGFFLAVGLLAFIISYRVADYVIGHAINHLNSVPLK
jgi:hypothetical protein